MPGTAITSFRIKYPDDFFINRIFASPKSHHVLESLSSIKGTIIPTHIAPIDLKQLQSEGKGLLTHFTFSGGMHGGFFHFLPGKLSKNYLSRLNTKPADFFYSLFYPVLPLFESWSGEAVDYSVESSRKVNMASLKTGGKSFFLKVRFQLKHEEKVSDFFVIYFNSNFIRNLGSFLAGKIHTGANKRDFLHTVTTINKAFKSLSNEEKLDLSPLEPDEKELKKSTVLFRSKYVNFEDFLSMNDQTIRIIMDDLNTRGFTGKNLALSLSRSTDELKNLFYKNLSLKRRQEIAENILIWEAPREKVLENQRTIVYSVIRLMNDERIKLSPELSDNVKLLEAEMRESAKKEAEEYIISRRFEEAVLPLNNRQTQLLIRRVNWQIIFTALQDAGVDMKRRFFSNLSDDSLDLLKEDISHWRKTQKDKIETQITIANSRRKLVIESKKMLREEKVSKLGAPRNKLKEIEEEFIETGY